MGSFLKLAACAVAGVAALGVSAASADRGSSSSGATLSISIGGPAYQDANYRGRYDNRRSDRGSYSRGYRSPGRSEIVKRRVFDTRHRAQIYLVEEVRYYRGGRRDLVCTIDVRGPGAQRVPRGQVRSVAARECSRRAQVRYV